MGFFFHYLPISIFPLKWRLIWLNLTPAHFKFIYLFQVFLHCLTVSQMRYNHVGHSDELLIKHSSRALFYRIWPNPGVFYMDRFGKIALSRMIFVGSGSGKSTSLQNAWYSIVPILYNINICPVHVVPNHTVAIFTLMVKCMCYFVHQHY